MSVALFLTPRLWKLAKTLRGALPRAENGADDEEAVHDLRVVIRRLRSLLKPARSVYGPFHTEAVRDALKEVANATGELRDEEVLRHTVGSLPLPDEIQPARAAWIDARKRREASLRQSLLDLLRSGQPARSLTQLEALLTLPVDPDLDRTVGPFAERVVERARRRVHEHQHAPTDDTEALHQLRILYKRLRYAAEGFSEVLPPPLGALTKVAEKFQKCLGEIHDVDVALAIVRADSSLDPAASEALLAALAQERDRLIKRYTDERQKHSVNPPTHPPAITPPPLAEAKKEKKG